MTAAAIHTDVLTAAPRAMPTPLPSAGSRSTGFASLLQPSGEAVEQQAREVATQFVATAFIMPVLEMLHDSPFATEPFAPNDAERRFAPLLDWQIADRVTSSANFPLVDRIVEQMLRTSEPTDARARATEGAVDVQA